MEKFDVSVYSTSNLQISLGDNSITAASSLSLLQIEEIAVHILTFIYSTADGCFNSCMGHFGRGNDQEETKNMFWQERISTALTD